MNWPILTFKVRKFHESSIVLNGKVFSKHFEGNKWQLICEICEIFPLKIPAIC